MNTDQAMPSPNLGAIRYHLSTWAKPFLNSEYADGLLEVAYTAPGKPAPDRAKLFELEDLAAAASFSAECNARRCNVYIGAALRKPGSILSKRGSTLDYYAAAFAAIEADEDADGVAARVKAAGLASAIDVYTGLIPEARVHHWFSLRELCDNPEELAKALEATVAHVGADPKVKDAARILRLGGTVNWVNDPAKRAKGYVEELTTLVVNTGRPVDLVRLASLEPMPGVRSKASGGRGGTSERGEITRNTEGKVTDGREVFWRQVVLLVIAEYQRRNGADPTADEVFRLAFHRFCNETIGDDRWTSESGQNELRKRVQNTLCRLRQGKLANVGLFSMETGVNRERAEKEQAKRDAKRAKKNMVRARVELVKGHTAEAASTTIDLLRSDPVVFDFGGQLALVEDGSVHPLCEHGLAYHLGTGMQFWKWVPKGKALAPVDCDPPAGLLKQIIAQGERRKLKPLDGLVTGPTIRLDGTILTAPGYDSDTRLLFDPRGQVVPEVPMRPTLEEAMAALDTLMLPFRTFPFVDPAAQGALLAAILTAVVRSVLPTAPAFAFDAPVQGSGKTLLASCIGALVEGRMPDIWPHTQGRDDEETRKRLFSALRTGCRAMVWDNIVGIFDSASMAAFITADAMVDRVLGKSESIRVPNRALLILTGNNLQLAGDLPRRVIVCRIDPETDQPFARQFAIDPLEHVLEHRMDMLAAACTLIRAQFSHQITPAPGRLASFEAWDDLVRQTVVWADKMQRRFDFGDPMELVREAQSADPEADALFALLDALQVQFGDAEFSAKEVMAAMPQLAPGDIETAIIDLAGDKTARSARSLGRVLKFREGRIVHGLRLKGRQDKNSGARMYRVQTVESQKYGFNGDNGSFSSHTEKQKLSQKYEWGETDPLNPSNPEEDRKGTKAKS